MSHKPRKRMIHPSIWGSVDFGTILVRTEEAGAGLFFIGLFSLADDHGIIEWNPERLGQEILRGLYIKHKTEIEGWVNEFCKLQMVDEFTHGNNEEKTYLMLPAWFDIQKVPHPKMSEQPLPPFELLDKYPGYKDGLSNSIQTFLRENQTNSIKCLNFDLEYAEYLKIDSNILGEKFESSSQSKLNKTKSKLKTALFKSDDDSPEVSLLQDKFNEFWKHYPKKRNRINALKAFETLNPDSELLSIILQDIEGKKETTQWKNSIKSDNGQYIPLPANYIREERWLDEGTEVKKAGESWVD